MKSYFDEFADIIEKSEGEDLEECSQAQKKLTEEFVVPVMKKFQDAIRCNGNDLPLIYAILMAFEESIRNLLSREEMELMTFLNAIVPRVHILQVDTKGLKRQLKDE